MWRRRRADRAELGDDHGEPEAGHAGRAGGAGTAGGGRGDRSGSCRPFNVFDVDMRSRITDPNAVRLRPGLDGTVTMGVIYGRVWLNDAAGFWATRAARRMRRVRHGHADGGAGCLEQRLAQPERAVPGDANYNSRNRAPDAMNPTDNTGATDAVPNDALTITINDLLNTDILNRDTNPGNNVTLPVPTAKRGEHHGESEAGHAGCGCGAGSASGGRGHGADAARVRRVRRGCTEPFRPRMHSRTTRIGWGR